MSRLTTSQVISLGQYLEPDFDPASLTVSQLLGVLGYHNIKYPTPYSKPKLVQVFNDEVKPRSAKLKKERLKKENSIASDEGIKDGLTGKPLTATRSTQPVRRSSRRLLQAPVQDAESPPAREASPKRRRSSAQPELAGPSRRSAAVHPALTEESEREDSPARIVVRNRELIESQFETLRQFAEESGWEDKNIFQSGAEDSSPVRPSPARIKSGRKSTIRKRSKKSLSAPPHVLPVSFPKTEEAPTIPQPSFEPDLGFSPSNASPLSRIGRQPDLAFNIRGVDSPRTKIEDALDRTPAVLHEERERPVVEEDTVECTPHEARKQVSVKRRDEVGRSYLPVPVLILVLVLTFAGGAVILQYKAESAAIGYCKRGTNSNEYLDAINAQGLGNDTTWCNWQDNMQLYKMWGKNNSSADEESSQETLPLCLPRPQDCTPCPEHATCDRHGVVCDTGYVLRSHPLLAFLPAPSSRANTSLSPGSDLAWKAISIALDGIPGLGSIALPPRCQEDPKRKRNIGALGKAIEGLLGQERGKRLCVGGKILTIAVTPEEGGEAKKWGVELGQLRETMRKKTSPHLLTSFDDTFNEAIQQLIQWGNIAIGEDQEGKRYLAHGTPNLGLACALIVKSREVWAQWRVTVLGFVLLILLALFGRARRAQRRIENKRVAGLVQTALNLIRNQEMAHHTDPITAPHPYLSSLQLRDLILQDEHSIPVRKRLWDQVERVVEENANVRVNLQEVDGGDEMRVWRWIGHAGRGPTGQKEGGEPEPEPVIG
ncbi:Man1-Src1p-C-terminal domain containing protein [Amanita muscaria]